MPTVKSNSRQMPPQPPKFVPHRLQQPPRPVTARGAHPPTPQDIAASYARIPPQKKLRLALGLFAFASFGVYMTYKFEEWYPAPKRTAPGNDSNAPVVKSQVDVAWEEEEKKEMERNR
ncbi:hypothetical protein HDU86_006866 [Geranomyces michiganensis]|nr:hypothetical protein HDU86_006866 [Geranomyces michiganensis]